MRHTVGTTAALLYDRLVGATRVRRAARSALTVRDGTTSSAADKLNRRSIELVTLSVGHTHGTSLRTQIGTNDAKLACETIGFIDCAVCVFEDHAALAFELRADDEIKIEVWHWRPQVPIARSLAESG